MPTKDSIAEGYARAVRKGQTLRSGDNPPNKRRQELLAYEPTARDRIARMLLGDNPSAERIHFVRGLMGSTGIPSGMGVADFVPGVHQAFGAQEAIQHGDKKALAKSLFPMWKPGYSGAEKVERALLRAMENRFVPTASREMHPNLFSKGAENQIERRLAQRGAESFRRPYTPEELAEHEAYQAGPPKPGFADIAARNRGSQTWGQIGERLDARANPLQNQGGLPALVNAGEGGMVPPPPMSAGPRLGQAAPSMEDELAAMVQAKFNKVGWRGLNPREQALLMGAGMAGLAMVPGQGGAQSNMLVGEHDFANSLAPRKNLRGTREGYMNWALPTLAQGEAEGPPAPEVAPSGVSAAPAQTRAASPTRKAIQKLGAPKNVRPKGAAKAAPQQSAPQEAAPAGDPLTAALDKLFGGNQVQQMGERERYYRENPAAAYSNSDLAKLLMLMGVQL